MEDDELEVEVEVRETFANRKDKLALRVCNQNDGSKTEHFDPGRPRGLKKARLLMTMLGPSGESRDQG